MREPVVIVGLGAEGLVGLNPRGANAVRSATLLAGGRRHLQLVGPTAAETLTITDNIETLTARLARRGPQERCVVLASGDPLFFGIGQAILRVVGQAEVEVVPAVSSMQLAFARVGLCWQDAVIASVHGRPLKPTLLPVLGRSKIGIFTRDGDGPSQIAGFFVDRGLGDDYEARVCEDLGSAHESVIATTLVDLVGRRFSDLNVLILLRRPSFLIPLEPSDNAFARPDSGAILLTHQDIRAMVVQRYRGLGEGPIWDLGAGLGGVSMDLARAFPDREIVAVERSPIQVAFLRTNRVRFGAYNVRVLEGEAPVCLDGEDAPAGVFLGGSGGKLEAILDVATDQLRAGGRLVANFVGLENLASTLTRLRSLGWETALSQIQISEGRPLAGLTTLVPQRPVWIISASKP